MAIYTGKLAYNVADNPLTDSLYVMQHDIGYNIPPPPTMFMITEDGKFMLTEDGVNLMITES
jgi:hypothetical protein